ncbi:hypothetical protein BUALT_Bualt08G0060300 [Buddleja alternifolia]|uniref:DUF8040 domain-containing protein n=1 Tax=Buddleja alternifolia TaxID=168488 RepID=A0AAV6XCL3_9LAMI|nr:hypothetical protein BUALT_Bualt08G0060300 [Buddleja alternifolia]
MSRNSFGRLRYLLENVGGLCSTKDVQITEQVAIFLFILAHHKKNVVVKHDFKRSGYTINAHFNNVLTALLRLHTLFLVKPQPIEEHCTNDRWKWFQGCLGALDGTYIPLSFALLKGRWAILRSNSFYLVKVQNRIIMACGLLHNFIRTEMPYDPLEAEIPEVDDQISDDNDVAFIDQVEPMRGGITNGSASKNCRRCWTVEEEKALADAMKDLVIRGYKVDNGFKSGYQNLLEQAMMQAFPSTTLKAEPHINSRITVWRKNYASISTMLTRSGFVEIFGKDRATGEGAEGFADVVQQLFNKDANLEQGKDVEDGGDYVPIFNNSHFDKVESMSVSNANTSGSSKSDKRKRKLVDENDARFIDLMSSFCDKTDNRLEDISRRIGFEHDASISRKAIFEAIGEVTSLDMESMIMVSQLIVKNTKNMDLFFSLPNNGRKTMVKIILEGKFPGNNVVA